MGLKIVLSVIVFSWTVSGCVSPRPIINKTKRYVACCDPGLSADDKSICKWMYERGVTKAQDFSGNQYEGVWQSCEPGKEPWRRWE